MKVWLTIEPTPEEIDLLRSKTAQKLLLQELIDHAYHLMSVGHEVSLKITTMKRRDY